MTLAKAQYDGTAYKLKFPTIDHICEAIKSKCDPYIAKIDISCAFRHLRIDPTDALNLGIQWNGNTIRTPTLHSDFYMAVGFIVLCLTL